MHEVASNSKDIPNGFPLLVRTIDNDIPIIDRQHYRDRRMFIDRNTGMTMVAYWNRIINFSMYASDQGVTTHEKAE